MEREFQYVEADEKIRATALGRNSEATGNFGHMEHASVTSRRRVTGTGLCVWWATT